LAQVFFSVKRVPETQNDRKTLKRVKTVSQTVKTFSDYFVALEQQEPYTDPNNSKQTGRAKDDSRRHRINYFRKTSEQTVYCRPAGI
jgi:hypothetical protein